MHICFPQSLTFLPSFRSPCESPFPPTPTVLCLFMSHRHSFLYVSLHPSQSQHWAEAAREEKNNEKTFFFHLVTKRTARTTTTSTITIKMDVLQHRSLASLERAVSEGCRGLTTSLRGEIEASEDRQQPVSRLCPRALWPAGHS